VAALPELVELAFPLLAPGGFLVAWKRGELADEVAATQRAMNALGGGSLEGVPVEVPGLAGHVLVVATRRGHVPAAYPRDPGARRRRPW
jgi:Predicted S-adenosylmethionine-dependent methyltransferase involved in bacterial cell division